MKKVQLVFVFSRQIKLKTVKLLRLSKEVDSKINKTTMKLKGNFNHRLTNILNDKELTNEWKAIYLNY